MMLTVLLSLSIVYAYNKVAPVFWPTLYNTVFQDSSLPSRIITYTELRAAAHWRLFVFVTLYHDPLQDSYLLHCV